MRTPYVYFITALSDRRFIFRAMSWTVEADCPNTTISMAYGEVFAALFWLSAMAIIPPLEVHRPR